MPNGCDAYALGRLIHLPWRLPFAEFTEYITTRCLINGQVTALDASDIGECTKMRLLACMVDPWLQWDSCTFSSRLQLLVNDHSFPLPVQYSVTSL